MITDFRISKKTRRPGCCNFDCCGNHFGRIERSAHANVRNVNRIIKSRRYVKHVERQMVRKFILSELD